MSYKITITPANLEFTVHGDEDLLSAALAAKINLPHGCKNGDCALCRCRVASGEIELDEYKSSALSAEQIAAGYTLICKSHPKSDVVLDLPDFNNSFPIKNLPSKIESITKTGTVAIVTLKLPANQTFEFSAGQYIDISYENKNRSYSIANSSHTAGRIELHIRYRNSGVFSEAVWNKLAVNQILRFKGPLGGFKLKDSHRPILMVCTGTGFAPLKAIIEDMIAKQNPRTVTLIWGNYIPEDFYLTELLEQWRQQLNLKTKLCVNERTPEGCYPGLVTDYIHEHYSDLSEHEIYACGNPSMIESLYNLATSELNLRKNAFFSDIFTPSV